jgi:putative DNA methylase
MSAALKPGAPLAFTYHHNTLDAYLPVAVAILDAGLVCSASIPCPAEMGASIHIKGTGSSIVDTVFVCRSTGSVPRHWIVDSAKGVAALVRNDVHSLSQGELKLTQGDVRCIIYGHLIRLAIWFLRRRWGADQPATERLSAVRSWVENIGGLAAVQQHLDEAPIVASSPQIMLVRENAIDYGVTADEIPF